MQLHLSVFKVEQKVPTCFIFFRGNSAFAQTTYIPIIVLVLKHILPTKEWHYYFICSRSKLKPTFFWFQLATFKIHRKIDCCFLIEVFLSQQKNANIFPENCRLLKLFLYCNLMGRIRTILFFSAWSLHYSSENSFCGMNEQEIIHLSFSFLNFFALLNTFAKVILLFVTFLWNIFMSCQGHQKILVCIRKKKHCYNQVTTSVRVHFLSLSFDAIITKENIVPCNIYRKLEMCIDSL